MTALASQRVSRQKLRETWICKCHSSRAVSEMMLNHLTRATSNWNRAEAFLQYMRGLLAVSSIVIVMFAPSASTAASCEKSRDNAADIPAYGSTVEFTRKIQVGVACADAHNRLMDHGRNTFTGIKVTSYPKGGLEYQPSAYGMTIVVKKVGQHVMKWTVNLKDQNGKPQFVNFVAHIEAVKDAW